MSKPIKISAHDTGYTCLAFSKDGGCAFTGGRDCIVRIWRVNEGQEQEPATAAEAEGGVTCIATTDDCWLSGSEDTEVRRYLKDSNQFDAPLTTTNGIPVRSIAIDPKGRRVAVASDEHFVKVIDMEDIKNVDRLEGYKAGVRSVTWSPSGSLLATCTSDGKIIIWNMSGQQPVIEKTLEGMIPAVTDAESNEFLYDCSVVWHPTGEHLYIATRSHEIVQVSCSTWAKTGNFSDKNVTGAITALGLSANGLYLASASQSTVYIWYTKTRALVTQQTGSPGAAVIKVAFSPKDNLVAWVDAEGAFTRWPKPIDNKFPDPVKVPASTTSSTTATGAARSGVNLFDGDNDLGVEQTVDDLANVDPDEDMLENDDGWIDDDMDGALLKEPEAVKRDGYVKEMVSITKAQPPFQPGSTPMENKRRYLAYNNIGVIEVTENDVHNIVNVDVFDRSLRKGFHFQDNFKCNLGYLGERGVLLACPPDTDHPAEIKFRSYTTWNAYEWTYTLGKSAKVLGIAVGALPLSSDSQNADNELQGYGNVVVATSEHDLTFLSGSGRERRILGMGGDFVTMAASVEWVFIVYRAGSTTIDGSQNLSYCMINFDDFSVRQRDVLPVPKGHTLKWVGLTNTGAPAIYDSYGYLHILTKYRIPHHASWARVLDTNLLERRQGKDESYWPVGVTDNMFMCLILKGRQEHPGFPRPLIQELPLQMPFRRNEEKEEFIEREMLHINIIFDTLDEELTTDDIVSREKAIDKEFLHLIQASCKANNIPRAIELTKLLHNTVSMELVTKVADFYHLPGFKEKVNMIKADREEAEDRLVVARNKRRRWLKPEPGPRQVYAPQSGSSSRYDPLSDTRPPPPIERPGLARVTAPVIEVSRYSSLTPSSHTPERNGWDEPIVPDTPPSTDGKRKRTEMDDVFAAPESSMPPPKHKTNPFARKPAQLDVNKNPFARRTDSIKLQKSDSFFDKVETAEAETGSKKRNLPFKKKEADSKDAPKKADKGKQATLFSMMPKADKALPKSKLRNEETQESETQEIETQITDVTMADSEQEGDSQQFDSLMPASPEWDETQLLEDSSIAAAQSITSEA